MRALLGAPLSASNRCPALYPATLRVRVRRPEVRAPLGAPLKIGEACGFHSFKASNYRLHFLEAPSGLKVVLNTDENAKDCREILQAIYANIFVEYVAKNPLYTPGQPFKCALSRSH